MRTVARRAAGIALTLSLVAWHARSLAAETALSLAQAFPISAARGSDIHFVARYFEARSGWHKLETWRHGEQALRRRTDDRVELLARAREAAPPGYDYQLIDHARRLVLRVSHGNLYRIGVFLDWFGLAHVLDRPKGNYALKRTAAHRDEVMADCQWVELSVKRAGATQRSRICWSARWGLPRRIRDNSHDAVWEDRFVLESVSVLPPDSFSLPPAPGEYAVFDADRELDPGHAD